MSYELLIQVGGVSFLYAQLKGYAMRRVVTILLVFIITITVLGCHKETDQDKVKKIMSNLSKTYSDPQGFDYEGIRGLLLGYFFRHPRISVDINNFTISVENTSAGLYFRPSRPVEKRPVP